LTYIYAIQITIDRVLQSSYNHLYAYLPTYLPTYLTYLPTYQPTYLPIYLHIYLPTYLSTYISIYLPTYLSIYLLTFTYDRMKLLYYWVEREWRTIRHSLSRFYTMKMTILKIQDKVMWMESLNICDNICIAVNFCCWSMTF